MNGPRTTTALRRWSCQDKALPSIEQIKRIHVYDFDNTLFSSPLPNRSIWSGPTCGFLQGQDLLPNGGWWHNPRILSAAGQGLVKEEARAWQGFWNESIVDLVRLSMEDREALTVLLTGRSEKGFADVLGRMAASKNLDFDIFALKPVIGPTGEQFSSTMRFKQVLLDDLIQTYTQAEEIRIYEDRPKHVQGFRDFLSEVNEVITSSPRPLRSPIDGEVVQVSEQECSMDPVTEVREVQEMINAHNQAILGGTAPPKTKPWKIKRTPLFTGYIISPADSERLINLIRPRTATLSEIRHMADSIMIAPRPADNRTLSRAGGLGKKVRWRVTGLSSLEGRIWAARVAPATPDTKFYTETPIPCVVLAVRRQTKPGEANRMKHWQPVSAEQSIEFDTTVGEKVLLRIEEEFPGEDRNDLAGFSAGGGAKNARKHPREEDFPALPGSGAAGANRANPPTQPRAQHQQKGGAWSSKPVGMAAQRGRGGGAGGNVGRGGGAGSFGTGRGRGAGSGRGRGGRGAYRSLDDNMGQGYGGDSMQY